MDAPGPRGDAVVFVSTFEPGFRGGGPTRSLARIVDSAPDSIRVLVVTSDRDLHASEPYPGLSGLTVPRGQASVRYLRASSLTTWAKLGRDLRRLSPDLMYLNSYWDPRFTMLPLVARLLGLARCPSVLIAPRGEFSPAALALKRHKKAAVDVIWKRVVRRSAGVTWHATSPHEAELIRSRFPGATIVVVPEAIADASASIEPSLVPSVPLKVIFVGRISPMKNLHLSIEALFHTRSEIQFDIFGPVEDDDYWRSCLDLARLLPHNVSLSHRGELQPEQVISMFARSEVFLFPTRGENFGHVIAESLAGGCPVLCSTNTPWSDLLDAGGGWAVRRLDAKALAEILDGYAELTAAERHARRLTAARVFADWQSARTTENVLVAAFSSRV